jgi:hypothetical protein
VRQAVDHGDVASMARAALPAKQLLRAEQMQEILLAVAFDPPLRIGRAEQLTLARAPAPADASEWGDLRYRLSRADLLSSPAGLRF